MNIDCPVIFDHEWREIVAGAKRIIDTLGPKGTHAVNGPTVLIGACLIASVSTELSRTSIPPDEDVISRVVCVLAETLKEQVDAEKAAWAERN